MDDLSSAHTLLRSLKAAAVDATSFPPVVAPIPTTAISYEVKQDDLFCFLLRFLFAWLPIDKESLRADDQNNI